MSEHADKLPDLRIAAALLIREDGHTLLVRKRGITSFMQPGGKIDSGRNGATRTRQGVERRVGYLGRCQFACAAGAVFGAAAHEAGLNVHADLFLVERDQSVRLKAEIEEIAWVAAHLLPDFPLAPLTGSFVLPLHNTLRRM